MQMEVLEVVALFLSHPRQLSAIQGIHSGESSPWNCFRGSTKMPKKFSGGLPHPRSGGFPPPWKNHTKELQR